MDVFLFLFIFTFLLASKLRKAGVFSRVDDSNTSIGKRYARNDELGTPFGVTLDFACTLKPQFLTNCSLMMQIIDNSGSE